MGDHQLVYGLLLGVVLGPALLGLPLIAEAPNASSPGEALFVGQCSHCHTLKVEPGADLLDLAKWEGPPLAYAGSKFRPEWLRAWMVEPTRIRPSGYLPYRYTAATPDGDRIVEELLPLHPRLSAPQAEQVTEFLLDQRRPINGYPPNTSGRALRAEVHFHKILPCGACHQTAPGKGGPSAPELYTAGQRLQQEWLLSFVTDPAYWSSQLMPRIPLRSDQLHAVAEFLESRPEVAPPPLPPRTSIGPGDGDLRLLPEKRPAAVYQLLCAQCHGIEGNGRGINEPHLFVSPRDHTSFEEMSGMTRDRLDLAIRHGGRSVGKSDLMPPWGSVLDRFEVEGLVRYLRELSGTAIP